LLNCVKFQETDVTAEVIEELKIKTKEFFETKEPEQGWQQ
jgi:hypothetical protein